MTNFWNDFRALSFFCSVAYGGREVQRKLIGGAEYYHARAAEMMQKAQAAPTKAIRQAYLNLAQKWVRRAQSLEKATRDKKQVPDPPSGKNGSQHIELSARPKTH